MNKLGSDIRAIKTKQPQNPLIYLKQDLVTESLDFPFHSGKSILTASAGNDHGLFLFFCLPIQSDRKLHWFLLDKYLSKQSYFSLPSVIILVSNPKSRFLALLLESSAAWPLSIHIETLPAGSLKSKTLLVTSIPGMQRTFYQVLSAKTLLLCEPLMVPGEDPGHAPLFLPKLFFLSPILGLLTLPTPSFDTQKQAPWTCVATLLLSKWEFGGQEHDDLQIIMFSPLIWGVKFFYCLNKLGSVFQGIVDSL